MELKHGIHLAYCTNVHRGGDWEETFQSLQNDVMRVRAAVCPVQPYAIGLRLGAKAAKELSDPAKLLAFQRWLGDNDSYVFTINGFPYGQFHGTRVKEQVYVPDWSKQERLEYTNLLFDILSALLPEGIPGSVSTLPGSFKEFYQKGADGNFDVPGSLFTNLKDCHSHVEALCRKNGQDLHLGLEPEPLGLFETTKETIDFLDTLGKKAFGNDGAWKQRIGVNYDTCHLAIEFEEPSQALSSFVASGYRLSKIHLSSALSLIPTRQAIEGLAEYHEPVYLHQVVASREGKAIQRWKDVDLALQDGAAQSYGGLGEEWRVHFHIPLHSSPQAPYSDTRSHVLGTLDFLKTTPGSCQHLEMETYTWEVLPEGLRTGDVVDQIVEEYKWTLGEMKVRGIA
jgi:hypothetical protein